MDHGERAIVPLNYVLIIATVALWAVSFPLWTTLVVAGPIAIGLSCIAFDKYGGMHVCLLAVIGWMGATVGAANLLKSAKEAEATVSFGYLALNFVGTLVGGVIVLLLSMGLIVGFALAWDWAAGKLGWRRSPSLSHQADERERPS